MLDSGFEKWHNKAKYDYSTLFPFTTLTFSYLKVTRHIREDQYHEDLRQKREERKNHSEAQIKILLAVPCHADPNVSDTDGEDMEKNRESILVSSPAAWRKQVAAWQSEMRDVDSDSEMEAPQIGEHLSYWKSGPWTGLSDLLMEQL